MVSLKFLALMGYLMMPNGTHFTAKENQYNLHAWKPIIQ
jgi:hypothetical protein